MSKGAYLHIKEGLFEVLVPQSADSKTHVSHQYAISHVQSIWVHTLASVSTAALQLAGLMILPNKIDIADGYIKVLKQDITFYRRMAKAGERITKVFQARTLNLYRQHLQGKINFVGFVRSKADATYRQLKKNMTVVVANG